MSSSNANYKNAGSTFLPVSSIITSDSNTSELLNIFVWSCVFVVGYYFGDPLDGSVMPRLLIPLTCSVIGVLSVIFVIPERTTAGAMKNQSYLRRYYLIVFLLWGCDVLVHWYFTQRWSLWLPLTGWGCLIVSATVMCPLSALFAPSEDADDAAKRQLKMPYLMAIALIAFQVSETAVSVLTVSSLAEMVSVLAVRRLVLLICVHCVGRWNYSSKLSLFQKAHKTFDYVACCAVVDPTTNRIEGDLSTSTLIGSFLLKGPLLQGESVNVFAGAPWIRIIDKVVFCEQIMGCGAPTALCTRAAAWIHLSFICTLVQPSASKNPELADPRKCCWKVRQFIDGNTTILASDAPETEEEMMEHVSLLVGSETEGSRKTGANTEQHNTTDNSTERPSNRVLERFGTSHRGCTLLLHFLQLIRVFNVPIPLAAILVGSLLVTSHPQTVPAGDHTLEHRAGGGLTGLDGIVLTLAAFLGTAAIQCFNDYEDQFSDAVNAPFRPIPSGKISAGAVLQIGYSCALLTLLLSALVTMTYHAAVVFLAAFVLTRWYSKLKKSSLVHHLLLPLALGLMPVYGAIVVQRQQQEVTQHNQSHHGSSGHLQTTTSPTTAAATVISSISAALLQNGPTIPPLVWISAASIFLIDVNMNVIGVFKDLFDGCEEEFVLPVVIGRRPSIVVATLAGVAGLALQLAAVYPLHLCVWYPAIPLLLGLVLTLYSRGKLFVTPTAAVGITALKYGRVVECLAFPAMMFAARPPLECLILLLVLTVVAIVLQQLIAEAKLPPSEPEEEVQSAKEKA